MEEKVDPDRTDLGEAAEAALFRALAKGRPGYVSCIDRQRRILFLNRAVSRNRSELVGKPLESFIAASHREAVIESVELAFTRCEVRDVDYPAVLVDGTRRHLSSRIVPFESPLGGKLALMLTDDVTEQWDLATKLERSEEFRRRVVEHLPDFVAMLDREQRFVWVNRLAPGLRMEDVIGKELRHFQTPGSLPAASEAIAAAFESATIGQYESEGYKDGQANASYLVRVAPIVLGGNVENVLLITSDITDRKHAEQALRQTEEQLHRAQRLESLGQLAGGIAHDFNNLLQVIGGNLSYALQLLESGRLPTEELEQSLKATRRAAALTSHLLAIGRRRRVVTSRLELGDLVAHAVRMLRRAIPENIVIRYDRPATPYFVELDAPQFDQVLINLCVNARDAMPSGGSLTIRIEPDETMHVVMTVSDTGTGIPPANLPRVFEPFFTTKGAGSGLGLAVAAGIVGAHGGLITAESDGVTGTTIKVRLGLVAPEPEAVSAPLEPASGGTGVVLVAEDEDMVRSQAVRILEHAGYTVIEAENGARAVELFRENRQRIDLVLLDAIMPELDGWQAFLRIRQLEPAARVLFTTGYAADVLPKEFTATGARLLNKPYSPQILLANVRGLIELERPDGSGVSRIQ
jgi:two-component system cell cycle sensor histidine kinase/response regulator CckA